jgi:hypothetical protein
MATKLYPTITASDISTADTDLKLATAVSGGGPDVSDLTATAAGTFALGAGPKIKKSSAIARWYSAPLNAVTISGTITANL